MGRFIEGCDRHQTLLLADCVDDYVSAENPARVIDVFVDELDLAALGFEGAAATGSARLSSGDAPQGLSLRLHEPSAVEPPVGARGRPATSSSCG